MAIQLRLRRGTKAECRSLNGAQGELTYATDSKQIFVNDGSTTGNNKPFMDTIIAFQEPSASTDYKWYRKYASGWIEQGGIQTVTGSESGGAAQTVGLPKTMANVNYTITVTQRLDYSGEWNANDYVITPNITTTGFQVRTATTSRTHQFYWEVKGMAA